MLKIGHGFLIIAISPIICLYKDFNMGKLSYLYANIIAFVGSFVIIFLLYNREFNSKQIVNICIAILRKEKPHPSLIER